MKINRNSIIRIMVLLLSIILVASLFGGCSTKKTDDVAKQQVQDKQNSEVSEKAEGKQEVKGSGESLYPIVKEPLTLTFFSALDAKVGSTLTNYNEVECFKKMEEITGIHIEWLHPPAGQETEQFNLMLASMDLPDMIWWGWAGVAGGPAKAINDGIIIRLNDFVNKHSIHLKKLLDTNETVRKQSVLDDGTVYMFPMVRLRQDRPKEWFKVYGWQARKDWLDRLGLQPPKTVDDMYNVMKAFKEQDANGNGDANDEIPLVSTGDGPLHSLAGAFGVLRGFYQESGNVRFGPIEEGFREYLATLNKWYSEGLLDSEYIVTDGKSFDAKITGDKAGIYCGYLAGNMGRYLNLMKDKYPSFDIIAIEWPVGPAGKPYVTNSEYNKIVVGTGTAITTSNKHIQESIKWLDYPYSEEGNILFNFGTEGESYELKNGYPTFTEIIFKHPEGYSVDQSLSRYCMAQANFSFVKDSRYFEQVALALPQQRKAQEAWDPADKSLLLPPVTLTSEESARFASIMTEIDTYVNEMFTKFVMSEEPLDNYNKFVENIKKLGIDEAIQIQQAALERYNNR